MSNPQTPIKATGFPSPGDDFHEKTLSLDELLIKKPSSTFFMRAKGNSMTPTINNEALLIVDRSLTPQKNSLIVAVLDNEFIIRRFVPTNNSALLIADCPQYKTRLLHPQEDFEIWGVVAHIIHKAL